MENHELISFGDLPVSDLMHHGIKGMKWGVRRYQNRDGSLTAAGKKRRAKLEAELDKLGGRKSDGDTEPKPKPKTVKEMSDDELRTAINRFQLEKQFKVLQSELNPKKVSAGKEFMKKLGKNLGDASAEAAKNAGKTFMEKKLKELLGVDDKKVEKVKTAYEKLKEKYDMEKLEYDMEKLEADRKKLRKGDKSQEDIDKELAAEAARLENRAKIIRNTQFINKERAKEAKKDEDDDD